MKTIQINATTLSEASTKAVESGMFSGVQVNATTKWSKMGSPEFGTKEFEQFAKEYTAENLKNCKGVAAIVCLDKGEADSRKRPYSIENVPNTGTRKYESVYMVLTTNPQGQKVILARITGKKTEVEDFIRDYYKKGGTDKQLVVECMHQVKKGEGCGNAIAMKASWSPSKNYKVGTYVAFGEIL